MDMSGARVDRPFRLAIVTDAWAPQVNGVVQTLGRTIAELRDLGHTVEAFGPQGHACLPCPGYPEIPLALMPGRRLADQLDAFAPEALHIATEGPMGLSARRYALRRGRPFTTAWHTRFPEYLNLRAGLPLSIGYRWLRRFHEPSSCVMVPTRAIRRELIERGFRRTAIWGRGVDTERFSPGPSAVFHDLPRPVWLAVGRLSVEKNLEAFLSLDLPGTKVVIGDGPQRRALEARHPDALFLGARANEELPLYYRGADVFVFPSRTDTFGLVLLEAMACGLPVAAYPVAGPLDVVGASGAGVLDEDLGRACQRALGIGSELPRRQAMRHCWRESSLRLASLLAVRRAAGEAPACAPGEPVSIRPS